MQRAGGRRQQDQGVGARIGHKLESQAGIWDPHGE